jgi:hypothetical protein
VIKKIVLTAFIFVVALVLFLRNRRSVPVEKWTVFDGKLATLEYPTGWEVNQGGSRRGRDIHVTFNTSRDEALTFSLIDYSPSSGKRDVESVVKSMIELSPKPRPIVVTPTLLGRFPAQSFSNYLPERTEYLSDSGDRVFGASYTEIKEIIFMRENGDICEIAYNLPKSGHEDYEPIFQKMIDSIRLK